MYHRRATWDREYLVDLHYMSVDQAVEVALIAAQDWAAMERSKTGALQPCRRRLAAATNIHLALCLHALAWLIDIHAPTRPLRIVTGAGRHSRDGRAKLLPNVQKALRAAGWTTEMFDSGSFLVTNPRPN